MTSMYWIMTAVMLACLLLTWGMARSEARPKKGLVLGVTLPPAAMQDPAVQALVRRFKRRLDLAGLGCAAALLPPLLLRPGAGAAMTWWMLWVAAAILLPMAVQGWANCALKALKRARGWGGGTPRRVVVDTAAMAALPKPVGAAAMLPPLALSIAPLPLSPWSGSEAGQVPVWVYLIDTAAILLLWACGRFTFRRRADMVSRDSALNQALLHTRWLYWNRTWVWMAWLLAAINSCIWLSARWPLVMPVGTAVFGAAAIGLACYTEFGLRRAQETLTAGREAEIMADEDDRWLFGQFYYNPDDARLMVAGRTGMNASVNLAHPAGKVIMALSALALVACVAIGPWISSLEGRDVALAVEQGTLYAMHGGSASYAIALDEVQQAALYQTLPAMARLVGTGLETYLGGQFSVQGGVAEVSLDPTAPPFLRVETAGGAVYWLNSRDAAQTRAAAAALGAAAAG